MSEKQYCPFCGKRLLPQIGSQTVYMLGTGTVTVRYYQSNSTEPSCFGNCLVPAINGSELLQQYMEAYPTWQFEPFNEEFRMNHSQPKTPVPQVFQEAFKEGELEL